MIENEDLETHKYQTTPCLPLLESFAVNCDNSQSEDEDELDQDKCYLLEIQQLKRQNNFLKKKIAELTKKHRQNGPFSIKKRPPINNGDLSERSTIEAASQNYIISFIEEITKLLQTFSKLFKIEIQSTISNQFENNNKALNELCAQNPQQLNRRLGRLLLSPEQSKFKMLLETFEAYYRQTTERNKNIRQKVESLTVEAIEMGKKMVQNVKQKEKLRGSIRGSRIFCIGRDSEQLRDFGQQNLMKSSTIKSTCTDSQFDFTSCRLALGKDKLLMNIF